MNTPNRWLILAVLFLARTAVGFQFQSIASVSPQLMGELGIDFALLGALISAWMLPGVFLSIPGGWLGQRLGDKEAVLLGLALMAAGSLMVAGADGYTTATAGRFVSGAGAVLLNVLLTKMTADWFAGRDLTTAMAFLVISWPAGVGLALVLLGPLSVATSWQIAVQWTAWVSLFAMGMVAWIYRRPPAQAAAPAAGAAAAPASWRLTRREFALVGIAGAIWAVFNAAHVIIVSFAPALLVAKGMPAAEASVAASFANWPLVLMVPIAGMVADRTGRGQQIMLFCFTATALATPFMLATPSPLTMLTVIGFVGGLAAGVIVALAARPLSPQSRHFGMGLFYTLYYLGLTLLPPAAGWARDVSGWDPAPPLFGSALLVSAIALLALYRRVERR